MSIGAELVCHVTQAKLEILEANHDPRVDNNAVSECELAVDRLQGKL